MILSDAIKMEVCIIEHGDTSLDLRGLTITKGSHHFIQDIRLSSGAALITTAYGVAPIAAMIGKCLWLRNSVEGVGQIEWDIVKNKDGEQILVPTVVKPEKPKE